MSAPTVQGFFATPVIEARVDGADAAAVVAAALELAERHTSDASQPAQPRFAWVPQVIEVVLAPGEVQALAASPGDFWVSLWCQDGGDVDIEDPRHALVAGDGSGLRHDAGPLVERVAVPPGGMVMIQGFLRRALRNAGSSPQRWMVIRMRPRRLNP